jgi:hypothetical protein
MRDLPLWAIEITPEIVRGRELLEQHLSALLDKSV